MDFALFQVEIYFVVGQHAGEALGDAFGLEDDIVVCHVVLLFLVWDAVCGGWGGLADDAGQDEHGQDVGSQPNDVGILQEGPLLPG